MNSNKQFEMNLAHRSKLTGGQGLRFALLILLSMLSWGASSHASGDDGASDNAWTRPVRVAKLLWKANPDAAAKTLQQAIRAGLARKQVSEAREALAPLKPLAAAVVQQGDANDPRYAVALAIEALGRQDVPSNDFPQRMQAVADLQARALVLEAWLAGSEPTGLDSPHPLNYLEQVLNKAAEEPQWAARVAAIILAARPQETAAAVLKAWGDLPDELRVTLVEPLTSRAETMRELIAAVADGRVPADLVNPNQLRKWSSHDGLGPLIESQWGTVREVDSATRQKVVAEVLQRVRSGAHGSYARGEAVFGRVCSQCHRFRNQGYEVGPDITSNGRGNLEQLASNIFDPSLVIGPAFQSQTVLTVDGEVLSGIVVADSPQYLTLKLQGGKTIELNKQDDIESLKKSDKSLMPEGLEQQLQPQELLDLLAYLALVKPLGEPANELIAGTPDDFVEP